MGEHGPGMEIPEWYRKEGVQPANRCMSQSVTRSEMKVAKHVKPCVEKSRYSFICARTVKPTQVDGGEKSKMTEEALLRTRQNDPVTSRRVNRGVAAENRFKQLFSKNTGL